MVDREQNGKKIGNGPWIPVPDPTVLTTAQLERAIQAAETGTNTRFHYVEEAIKKLEDSNSKIENAYTPRTEHHLLLHKVDDNQLARTEATDKVEKNLQGNIDKVEKNMQDSINAVEKRLVERVDGVKALLEKSDEVLTRFAEERATYITRNQLDDIRQSINGDIKPLSNRDQFVRGRDSVIYFLIAIGASVVTLLISHVLKAAQ